MTNRMFMGRSWKVVRSGLVGALVLTGCAGMEEEPTGAAETFEEATTLSGFDRVETTLFFSSASDEVSASIQLEGSSCPCRVLRGEARGTLNGLPLEVLSRGSGMRGTGGPLFPTSAGASTCQCLPPALHMELGKAALLERGAVDISLEDDESRRQVRYEASFGDLHFEPSAPWREEIRAGEELRLRWKGALPPSDEPLVQFVPEGTAGSSRQPLSAFRDGELVIFFPSETAPRRGQLKVFSRTRVHGPTGTEGDSVPSFVSWTDVFDVRILTDG